MNSYIGSKLVTAKPMSLAACVLMHAEQAEDSVSRHIQISNTRSDPLG